MAKYYIKHDYKITGKDYVETDGGDTPGGVPYSTEEQDTGLTWIDGSPIYQKTFSSEFVTVTGTGWETTDIDLTGLAVKDIIAAEAMRDVGTRNAAFSIFQYAITNDNKLQIALNSNAVGIHISYITIRYTKSE